MGRVSGEIFTRYQSCGEELSCSRIAPSMSRILYKKVGQHFVDGVVLHGFDINRILDDMTYQVCGDPGLIVYVESYGQLVHFNADACIYSKDVGYARPGGWTRLALSREDPDREIRA